MAKALSQKMMCFIKMIQDKMIGFIRLPEFVELFGVVPFYWAYGMSCH
jgi:hypothetical protein